VQPDRTNTRRGEQVVPRLPVGALVQRPAVRLREEGIAVLPPFTGQEVLAELGGAMRAEQVDQSRAVARQGAVLATGWNVRPDPADASRGTLAPGGP
jgi:hypothetical protein